MAALGVDGINEKVLFSGSSLKQALKECDKKLLKRPADPHLLYWKAAVHLKFGRDDDAFRLLLPLCVRTPPVTDPDLLRAVYFRLAERETAADARKSLWLNAFKATNDGQVLVTWFESAASMDCWPDAQVALVTLKNKYPKDEHYHFALPAVQQLAADMLVGKDERYSSMMSMIASKTLSVAVMKAMKAEKSVDAITTRRELRLVLQIYRKQGMRKEILDILDHPTVGLFSPLVVCDLAFVRTKLDVLEEGEMWQELWAFCVAALRQTHTPDEASKISYSLWPQDYAPWRGLHTSYRALLRQGASDTARTDELSKTLEEIHGRYADTNLRVRLLPKAAITPRDQEDLYKNCCAYTQVFAKEQCCYDDISPYAENLDESNQTKFQDWCHDLARDRAKAVEGGGASKQQVEWLRTEIIALKIKYQLGISKGQTASKDQLEAFVCDAIRVYGLAVDKDVPSCEDACALTVMALVGLHRLESSQDYLVQAEIMMRELLSRAGDSRKAGLLQSRLMSFMGNFGEAMDAWSELRIKEILMETLAHHMFTRMSINHPFQYGSKLNTKTYQDPLLALDRVLQTSDKILHTLQAFIGADMDALQYDRLLEIVQLKTDLSRSLSRKLFVIERRRTKRMRGEVCDDLWCDVLDDDLDALVDNRDLQRMWSYEHSGSTRFEECIASGPTPGRYWLALFLLIDDTCTVISSPDSQRITIGNIEKVVNNATPQDLAELTPGEKSVIPGWVKLRALARKALFGDGIEETAAHIEDLKAWLSDIEEGRSLEGTLKELSIKDKKPPGYLPLLPHTQPMLLLMELLQACSRLCDAATRVHKNKSQKWWGSIPVKDLAALRTVAQEVFGAVRQRVFDWKNRLSDGAAEDLVARARHGITGEAMEKLLGGSAKATTAAVAGLLLRGANDTLDGVLRVKLA